MKKITFLLLLFLCFQSLFSQDIDEENTLFEKGKTHFYKKFHTGDRRAFKEADSIFTILKQRGNFASVRQEIATDLYLIRCRLKDPAKDNLQHISELIERYKSQNVKASELYEMLVYYQQFFRYKVGHPEAEDKILELIAQQLDEKEPNYEVIALAYDNLDRAKYQEGNYKKAAEYGEKSITYSKKTGFKGFYISAIQATGACYHWLDKVELSLQYMEKAYRLIKTLQKPDLSRLSRLSFNIALMNAGQLANKQKSIKYFKEAISYEIEANGETNFLVMLYALLADVHYELKDLEQSEFYADKGYILANDILHTKSVYYRSLPSMSYSRIYTAKGNYEKARQVIDKVVKESIAFFGEDDKFTVQAFIDKANVELEDGNYEVAETYLLRAIRASKKVNRVYTTLSAYQQLCELYLKYGKYQKAVAAAKIYQKLDQEALEGDYLSAAEANFLLAEGYLGLKVLDSASTSVKRGQNILHNGISDNDIIIKLKALSLETKILLEKYKAKKSLNDLNQAYALVQRLINEIIAGKSSFKYNTSKLYYSESVVGYINTAMEICDLKYTVSQSPAVINRMFKLMELNKSSVLLDGINELDMKKEFGIPKSLIKAETKLETRLSTLNKELYSLKDKEKNAGKAGQFLDQRLVINKSLDSIQNILKADYPNYYEATGFKKTKKLTYYQKNSLEKDQALVEYYIAKNVVYRITLTKNNLEYDRIIVKEDWQKMVAELYQNLIERREIATLSSELGSLLLPKFPASVNDVIFVLDGTLNQIPFEILQLQEEYLINAYNINYAGSLQLYEKQKEIVEKQNFNWIGFAPKYEEGNLFDNKNEVRSIDKIVSGSPILGEEATKQKLIELGKKASVLHLATHTELDKLNPMLNKILFSENDMSNELTTSEIYGMHLKADLAVLSACNTGTGRYRGDGVMSMSRAFTYAGTSSTVMSLWKVPDKQTSELMVLFYKFLKKGQTKSEALRNAKLAYLKEVKYQEFTHPYYWAGFVLTGDNSPIDFSESFWEQPIFYIILVSVLIILLVVIYFRKRKNNSTSL